ncbi:MAG: hypothetical protein WAV55_03685 [Clostridiaceae bacterium]
MKKITYIKASWCPYCSKADNILTRLKRNNDQYNQIEFEIIDEDLDPQKAAQYQYELVPNMWLGQEKVLEGIPSTELLKAVLDKALEGAPDQGFDKNSRYEDYDTEATDADTTTADTKLPQDLPGVEA